jgi:hypothetical protein
LVIADFSRRPDHVWRAQDGGVFLEVSSASKVGDAGFPYLGFGAGFFDYDCDGWLDLFIANGHVYPEVEMTRSGERYLQPNQLFHNLRNGTFAEVSLQAGPAFLEKRAARGAAFGDYDNDGDLDILVNNNDGRPSLLRNDSRSEGHFLNVRLAGSGSNRDAVGARVRLDADTGRQMRDVKSGGSYLSSSDPRLHFGLGAATLARQISVRWPSGSRQVFRDVVADRFYLLKEGEKPRLLHGRAGAGR